MNQTRGSCRHATRVALCLLALILAAGTPALAGEANTVTTRDLLASPDKWHGRPVVVSGTVTRLEPRVSQRGNAYFTFRLADAAGAVTVFAYGTPEVGDGERVQVEGIFHKVKRVGKHAFPNQVDATRVHPR